MAGVTRYPDGFEGVEFVREADGTITARDLETGLVRGGEIRVDALAQLAEVLILHEGGGEPIKDPDAFLRGELEMDPTELEDQEPPDFLR